MYNATTDREALDLMLNRSGKPYKREASRIHVTIAKGKELIFQFGPDGMLKRTHTPRIPEDGTLIYNLTPSLKDLDFGSLTEEKILDVFPGTKHFLNLDSRTSIVGVPQTADVPCIKVVFPQGLSELPSEVKWLTPLPKSREYYYEYNVYFGSEFDFQREGKLPGIGGGLSINETNPEQTLPEWESTFVWTTQGRVCLRINSSDIRYLKHLNNDSLFFDVQKWHRLQCHTILNTPGLADGTIEIWVDGIRIYRRTNVSFMAEAGIDIEWFYFGAGFYGTGEHYEPVKDEHLLIRNFKIATSVPL